MDDNTYTVYKASNGRLGDAVINSIDDLKKIAKQHNAELIINFDEHDIIIYDDYIE